MSARVCPVRDKFITRVNIRLFGERELSSFLFYTFFRCAGTLEWSLEWRATELHYPVLSTLNGASDSEVAGTKKHDKPKKRAQSAELWHTETRDRESLNLSVKSRAYHAVHTHRRRFCAGGSLVYGQLGAHELGASRVGRVADHALCIELRAPQITHALGGAF